MNRAAGLPLLLMVALLPAGCAGRDAGMGAVCEGPRSVFILERPLATVAPWARDAMTAHTVAVEAAGEGRLIGRTAPGGPVVALSLRQEVRRFPGAGGEREQPYVVVSVGCRPGDPADAASTRATGRAADRITASLLRRLREAGGVASPRGG